MRANKPFNRMEYLPVKFIPLFAALLALAMLVSTGRPAEAQRVNPETRLSGRWDTMPQQVAPEEDARLRDLSLIAGGLTVVPTPTFDSDIMRYAATITSETVNVRAVSPHTDAVIDQITVAGETTVLDSLNNLLDTNVDVVEGAITQFSLRVVAEDGITTKTYYIDFSRPAAETVPDITIEADPSQYVAGLGLLDFTLTREGDTTDSLDVSVRLSQDQPWLSDTVHAATFEAGTSETSVFLPQHLFSSEVTQSGDLVAIVAAVDGYDTSGARKVVEVISQMGPAVTVTLEHSSYTFAEDVGQAKVALVARAVPGLPYVPRFSVTVVSADQSATAGAVEDPLSDYLPVSSQIPLLSSDFQDDEGSLVARKEVSITIHDDNVHESDEQFYLHLGRAPGLSREVSLLDAGGNQCSITCPVPYPVTIEDNDPQPVITIAAPEGYLVGWGMLEFRLTRTGDLTDGLDVVVNLEQTRPWLSTTSYTVTFDAEGDDLATLRLPAADFATSVTESGEITATVAAVDGYDTSDATATVRVHPHAGSRKVRVSLGSPSYSFAEDAGQVNIQVVARPETNLPYIPSFYVNISSERGTAKNPGDYADLSASVWVTNSHFTLENGQRVGRVNVPLTINDDTKYEGDEMLSLQLAKSPGLSGNVFLVDPEGNDCVNICDVPYPVTITENDPAPTITAPDDYLVGWGDLTFTLNRVGDLSEKLDVTVDFDQALPWLSTTSYTVTFEAEDAEETLTFAPDDFSTTVTQSGAITATVDGHTTGGATVRVHPYDGSPVRVSVGSPTYAFSEDAGNVKIQLVARPGSNLPFVPTFQVGVATAADTAASPEDYGELSTTVSITNADFVMEGGHQVARVDLPITIVDDFKYEGDESFGILLERPDGLSTNVILVDAEGNDCEMDCQIPYLVTITENDPPVTILTVGLQHTHTGALTSDDNGRDEYNFDGNGGTQYIIEVKHPLQYADPDESTGDTHPTQIPGYLVDPSILEITDDQRNLLLGEHDDGGFTLRWARAFFTPLTSGTYRIAVGAGSQDRGGKGGYTISIRVDDHADDFKTEPDVLLLPGQSITARIDSDVAPEDLGLNYSYWGGVGIEMLDDRDVIQFQITDTGTYNLELSGQPTGVGIRYVWDHRGNLFAKSPDPENQPLPSAQYAFDPGAYYVEVGTPYESEGNTGAYTLSLAQVNVLQ